MYFAMEEDKRVKRRIRFKDIQTDTVYQITPEMTENMQEMASLFMEGDEESIYPDFFVAPLPLVSDRLKKVLELYDKTSVYKSVVLNQTKEKKQHIYWLVRAKEIDCLDERSEFYPNGQEKKIVLNEKSIGTYQIFQPIGLQRRKLIVRQEVAESIIRRKFDGILFEPI